MRRAESEGQKHGNLYRQTDRRNSAKHKEIGQHVAAFHHIGKGKKEKIKMKVQKGWPHDMATRNSNSTKQEVTVKVTATPATALYSLLLSAQSDEEFRRLTCWCFCVLSRGVT
jgi:hypothetical protein